jgi:hypothetical protein
MKCCCASAAAAKPWSEMEVAVEDTNVNAPGRGQGWQPYPFNNWTGSRRKRGPPPEVKSDFRGAFSPHSSSPATLEGDVVSATIIVGRSRRSALNRCWLPFPPDAERPRFALNGQSTLRLRISIGAELRQASPRINSPGVLAAPHRFSSKHVHCHWI